MFKKIALYTFVVIAFIIIICIIKESVLNNPTRIYNKTKSKYESLTGLSVKKAVYSPKRTTTYALRYMTIIPMGKAKMFTQEQEGKILLSAVAQPPSFVKNIYDAKAEIESLIDGEEFYPLRYREVTITPEKERKKEMLFYQSKNIMERDGNKYQIPAMTFCPVSAFYFLQVQNLEVGQDYEIPLISKEDIYLFKMKVISKKDNIFKLKGSVRRRNLSSSHGADFTVWITDDMRIPLLFKVWTQAGSLTGRLILEE